MGEDLTTIPVQGYEEYLTVSESGEIHRIAYKPKGHSLKKLDDPKLLKVHYTKNIASVKVSINGEFLNLNIGKTVYTHFKGKLDKSDVVGHIDGDITHNHADNLYKYKRGLKSKKKDTNNK